MEPTEGQVFYGQGYWDGVADLAEYVIKLIYPFRPEKFIDESTTLLIKRYKEHCNNESRDY